jgi:AraC-like DNA-binding protein
MLSSASSVKEVALSLGFSSPEQMARDFKRRFGLSPSALLNRPGVNFGEILSSD